METNLLQQELERVRSSGEVNDLTDTNFHRNGYQFPAAPIADAMNRYLAERAYDPDPKGATSARESVSSYYHSRGLSVPADNLILTASSSESYNLLFMNFTSPGDNILLPRPTYPLFEYLAGFNHLEVRFYDMNPSNRYQIDLASLEACMDSKTRFVVLISPNNPTGRAADDSEIEGVVRLLARRGIMLIVDEVFSEFLYAGATLVRPAAVAPSCGYRGPIFTLNGISKMFASPDLKLGWIAVSGSGSAMKDAVDTLEIANDMFLNCNSFSQFLLPTLFDSGAAFQRDMVERLDRSRSVLVERVDAIDGARMTEPNGGIHCIIELDGYGRWDDEQFAIELLRRKHVFVHPGYLYGIDSALCVVVSFLREHSALRAGMDAFADFVAATRGDA